MNLNMSKFKKLAEDKKSATFQHPDGHQITVAKHVLSPGMRGELEKMPLHLAEGTPEGTIEDSSDENDMPYPASNKEMAQAPEAAPPTAPQTPTVVINNSPPQAQQTPVQPEVHSPANPPPPQVSNQGEIPAAQPNLTAPIQNDPYGTQATMNAYGQGLQNQTQGIQGQAQAEGALGQAQAKQLDQNIQIQQQQAQNYQSQVNELNQERQHFISDVQNQHIDPQHYLNSMGTGGKIATAIGLIIGGFGGPNNAAQQFLNTQISNDIDAQNKNLGKSENLLSANMRQYGNIKDAMDMTRVQQMDIVKNQLQEAAAKAATPLAQAHAQQAIGQLDMQAAPIIGQMAMRRTALAGTGTATNPTQGSAQGGISPEQKIAFLSQTPAEAEAAGKELTSVKNHSMQVDKIMTAFDQANQDNTLANRIGHLGYEPASIGVIKSLMMPYLKDAEGRINESELERTDLLIPNAGDSPQKIAEKKQGLQDFLQEKQPVPVLLPKYGIDPTMYGTHNAQGRKKIQLKPPVQ